MNKYTHRGLLNLILTSLVIVMMLLTACTPQEINTALSFNTRFFMSRDESQIFIMGELPNAKYAVAMLQRGITDSDSWRVIWANMVFPEEALAYSQQYQFWGWFKTGFWALPLPAQAVIVATIMEVIQLPMFMVPAGVIPYEKINDSCWNDAYGFHCNL